MSHIQSACFHTHLATLVGRSASLSFVRAFHAVLPRQTALNGARVPRMVANGPPQARVPVDRGARGHPPMHMAPHLAPPIPIGLFPLPTVDVRVAARAARRNALAPERYCARRAVLEHTLLDELQPALLSAHLPRVLRGRRRSGERRGERRTCMRAEAPPATVARSRRAPYALLDDARLDAPERRGARAHAAAPVSVFLLRYPLVPTFAFAANVVERLAGALLRPGGALHLALEHTLHLDDVVLVPGHALVVLGVPVPLARARVQRPLGRHLGRRGVEVVVERDARGRSRGRVGGTVGVVVRVAARPEERGGRGSLWRGLARAWAPGRAERRIVVLIVLIGRRHLQKHACGNRAVVCAGCPQRCSLSEDGVRSTG